MGQDRPLVNVDEAGINATGPILDTFSPAMLTQFAGNAMSGPCVGSVLWWVFFHVFAQLDVSLPKTVQPSVTRPTCAIPMLPEDASQPTSSCTDLAPSTDCHQEDPELAGLPGWLAR